MPANATSSQVNVRSISRWSDATRSAPRETGGAEQWADSGSSTPPPRPRYAATAPAPQISAMAATATIHFRLDISIHLDPPAHSVVLAHTRVTTWRVCPPPLATRPGRDRCAAERRGGSRPTDRISRGLRPGSHVVADYHAMTITMTATAATVAATFEPSLHHSGQGAHGADSRSGSWTSITLRSVQGGVIADYVYACARHGESTRVAW